MPPLTSLHQERLAATQAWLAENGFDALVLFAMGSGLGPGTRTHGAMRFLCGWDSHHNPSILVLRPRHEPVLLVTNVFLPLFAREHFFLPDVRLVPPGDLAAATARLCREGSQGDPRLALVGRNEMPAPLWEGLSASLADATWSDATDTLDRQRVVKSNAELALHEKAAAVCDDMFETLRREIHEPRPAFQLQAEMERSARYAGCEYCMTWLTVGPRADYSRTFRDECQRVPERGDQVIAGIYVLLDGYWGHAIRTGQIGQPSAAQQRIFEIASGMQAAMREALTPGRDLNDVQAEGERVLRDGLRPDELACTFRFRDAHALGYSYEDPIATAPFPQPYGPRPHSPPLLAVPGMVFELHPNLFVPDLAGACLGDMVAVTETGNRILTMYSTDLQDWTQ